MRPVLPVAAFAALMIATGPAAAQSAIPSYASAAVADAGRPQADKDRDVHRKPAEMLVFGEIKPGAKVGELIPGRGYFTRIFSKAVGPTGRVYAIVAPPRAPAAPAAGAAAPATPPAAPPPAPTEVIAADPAYSNVTVLRQPYASWKAPEPLDVVWTSQNYHDMRRNGAADMVPINKAVFENLKPGGIYIVLDHRAPTGSTDTSLHRIDPALVKSDVLAAGFEFVGESDVLSNPKDVLTITVMDNSVRGDTNQFIYKFRKPGPK